jgi:O-antigen/teichoic acid export membrane protein
VIDSREPHPDASATGDPDALSRDGLRTAAVSGARWVLLARVGGELLAFAATLVLARLITPAEFGHAAVPLILPMLAVVLTFQGVGAVLVQRKQLSDDAAATATLLSVSLGFALALGVWATAGLWAEPIFGARTAELLRLATPVFAIAGLGVVPRARLQRSLAFRRLSVIEVVAFATGAAASVVLAGYGLEGDALVLGVLIATTVETALLCAAAKPTRPRFVRGKMREILSFGGAAAGAAMVGISRRNVDYVILSAQIAPAQVGFYWRAFQLGASYQAKFTGIMQRLSFPLFSRTATADDMRVLRARVVRTNVGVLFPILATFVVTAPIVVPVLYGAAWEPAVLPAQILAVCGMALTVQAGTESLTLALGRPRQLLLYNLAFLLALALVILGTAREGLLAVCIGVSAVHVAFVALGQWWLMGRIAGIPIRDLLQDVAPATAASAAALVASLAVSSFGAYRSLGDGLELLLLGTLSVGIYVAVLSVAFGEAWSELRRTVAMVIRLRPKNRPVRSIEAGIAQGTKA